MLLERIPIRYRLSIAHAMWMGLLFLSIGFGLFRLVQNTLYESIDAALLSTAKSIKSTQAYRNQPFNKQLLNSFSRSAYTLPPSISPLLGNFFGQRVIRPYAQVIDLSGKVSAKSETNVRLPVSSNAISQAQKGQATFETYNFDGDLYREITFPIIKAGFFTGELIQVATSLEPTEHTLKGVKAVLWTAFPAGLLLSVFFGYQLTKRSLKPVHRISQTAAQLEADRLGTKLPIPAANDELKELTQTFNGMLDRLEDAFKRLRYFSSNVSHELRTPLAVMRGEAELALRKDRTPEEYQKALKTIVNESEHMTHIIEDLLLFAKAQSGSVVIEWQELDASDFMKKVKDSLRPIFNKKGIDFRVHLNGVRKFVGSENLLMIAIKNVVLNAIKHTPEKGVVSLDVWPSDSCTNIRIADQGEGIPKEALPYIFDPFYRVDTDRNRRRGGTGIGLSLTEALIRLHKGKVEVFSEEGKGTEFSFIIPSKIPKNGNSKGTSS